MNPLEEQLEIFIRPEPDDVGMWTSLIEQIRPTRASDVVAATTNIESLTTVLARRTDIRQGVRASLSRLIHDRKLVSLYVSSGLLPSSGFFSETSRRIVGRMLPEVIDADYMRGVLNMVFSRPSDEIWVNAIDEAHWMALVNTLFDPDEAELLGPQSSALPEPLLELIEALRILSYHVSSIGLDPELVRIDPVLEEHESPFLAQNAELVAYLAHYGAWWTDGATPVEDERHLDVMLGQCEDVVARIRRRAAKVGTSLSLTFKLERLQQHLERITVLLAVLTHLRAERNINSIAPQIVRLVKELIRAECRKHNLSDYWGKNVELLSLRMTESASRSGERYITSTRREYFGILRSAALGGVIITLMATLKIVLGWQGYPPMSAALAFCLNYGIGFALIHILGGTVATKQPAMTANAIAASIGEAKGKSRNLDNLVELIARTVRSQLAAILGNVGVAVPMAIAIGLLIHNLSGNHFVSPDEARRLIDEVHPLSGAVVFAAIAGICLFLSGLIAGYYDNLCAYGRIPERLLQLRWPRRVFGEARMVRVAAYVEDNLGAMAGNFFFGFLLGGVAALGVLFGLPLDIRHIAFSSAYVGHAITGLDFGMPLHLMFTALVGLTLIGIINLTVSFSLTLSVAMRARRITFAQGQDLLKLVGQRFRQRPADFILPPRTHAPETAPLATDIAADTEGREGVSESRITRHDPEI